MDFSQIWEQAQSYFADYGLNIIFAIIILILGYLVAKAIKSGVHKMMKKHTVETTLARFVANLVYAALMIFVILAALGRLGIETTSFIAILGAAGLAIGLALQGALSNFAAGFLLILFRPIKSGEFVEAGGAVGVVEEVSIFTTTILSVDNVEITVPNAMILGSNIRNYSRQDNRRIDLLIGVSYSDDLKKTKQVIMEVLEADSRVLNDPAPRVAVAELGDSSVNFVVRPWVKSVDYWDTRFAVIEAIKERLDKEGISIPFPQRDIHLFQDSKTG
jgi:small conductance mechanosensitive channel